MAKKDKMAVVLFFSTSIAMRAEKIAKDQGMEVKLIPTPRHLSSDCGTALRFRAKEKKKMVKALEGNKVAEPRPAGAGVTIQRAQYSHDLIAEEALGFIESNKDGPFFLYLTVTIPHANNEAGQKGMEVPDYGIYKDKDWPEPQKGHAAMITRLDRDVGRIMKTLKKSGIDEKTLVLFSSDNGPHREGGADPEFFDSSGLLRGHKRDLYEGGIRVPLIARWPGKVKPGAVSRHVSAFWDFLPTFAELAGAKPPPAIDGISMLPTLLGRPTEQKEHEVLYWEFHERGSKQAVRMGRWKAVRFGAKGKLELYDLKNDIGETRDVAGRHPQIAAKIGAYLQTARTKSNFWEL